MRSTALLLLLSLSVEAQPVYLFPDGGIAIVDVERAAILVPQLEVLGDGGMPDPVTRIVHVDGGSWVSADERVREGQEHVRMASRNQYLEEHASDVPTFWVGVGAASGAASAAAVVLIGLAAAGRLK